MISLLNNLFTTLLPENRGATPSFAQATALVKIAKKGLTHFQQGNLKAFDALVGESQCQIRAYKVIHLKTQGLEVAQRIEELDQVLRYLRYHQNVEGALPVMAEPLNEGEQFLILSHLLFRVRGHEEPGKSVARNLSEVLEPFLRQSFLKKELNETMFQAKKNLAQKSVQTIQQIATIEEVNVMERDSMIRLPCYLGLKAILNALREQQGKILLKLPKFQLLFSPNAQNRFQFVEPESIWRACLSL